MAQIKFGYSRVRMTDRAASLNPAALREIIGHLDDSLKVMDSSDRHTLGEIKIKSMITALRRQLLEYLVQRINDDLRDQRRPE